MRGFRATKDPGSGGQRLARCTPPCLGPGVATPPPGALLSPRTLLLIDLRGQNVLPNNSQGPPTRYPGDIRPRGQLGGERGTGAEGQTLGLEAEAEEEGTADPSPSFQDSCSQEHRGVEPYSALWVVLMPSLGMGRVPGRKHPCSGRSPGNPPKSHEK